LLFILLSPFPHRTVKAKALDGAEVCRELAVIFFLIEACTGSAYFRLGKGIDGGAVR
jgi:hypothetical protein